MVRYLLKLLYQIIFHRSILDGVFVFISLQQEVMYLFLYLLYCVCIIPPELLSPSHGQVGWMMLIAISCKHSITVHT